MQSIVLWTDDTPMCQMVCLHQAPHESAKTDGWTQTEYLTHRIMVIQPYTKYGKSMAKNYEVKVWTQVHDIDPFI